MTDRKPPSASRKRTRKTRPRPRPTLLASDKLDQVGRRRCLMLLEVLSGRVSVTDAIAKAKISRGTYYQLETKALTAMLTAMTPGSPCSTTSSGEESRAEIDKLHARVDKLQADKRRLERLLSMTKKVVGAGKLTTGRRGPRKARRSSVGGGRSVSPSSTTKTSATTKATKRSETSTPSSGGEAK